MALVEVGLAITLPVRSLDASVQFFCDLLAVARVVYRDNELVELELCGAPGAVVRCELGENRRAGVDRFDAILYVADAWGKFRLIEEQWRGAEWEIQETFFGRYLSTPVGDQFAVESEGGASLLICDGRRYRGGSSSGDCSESP